MTAKYKHRGIAIDYTPGSDVTAGDVVVQEDLIGIAVNDIPDGRLGALTTEGVFELPKATGSGSDIDAGAQLYWNGTDDRVEKTEGSPARPALGKAVAAAAVADETVLVKINV